LQVLYSYLYITEKKNAYLPIKPSIQTTLETSIYFACLFFEGTNVSVGRGTEKISIYGSPYLPQSISVLF
jgi:uncharacterized protein YbbC (DUF1343 family)